MPSATPATVPMGMFDMALMQMAAFQHQLRSNGDGGLAVSITSTATTKTVVVNFDLVVMITARHRITMVKA